MMNYNYDEYVILNAFCLPERQETITDLQEAMNYCEDAASEELLQDVIEKLQKMDNIQYTKLYDQLPLSEIITPDEDIEY